MKPGKGGMPASDSIAMPIISAVYLGVAEAAYEAAVEAGGAAGAAAGSVDGGGATAAGPSGAGAAASGSGGDAAGQNSGSGGAGGGPQGYSSTDRLWLWPLPPEGPIEFVMQWPALGVEELRYVATPMTEPTALLVTLEPGAYTAQVSGVGNSTGVALIEIYEAP